MLAPRVLDEINRDSSLSVVDFVNYLVEDAFIAHVSDVHLHPTENNIRIRFRIDGLLQDVAFLPRKFFPEIVSRIKILSNLRTDEHKNPQDGRFQHTKDGEAFDVRVSCVPTYHGESVVLRLLTNAFASSFISDLGFLKEDEEKILSCIKKQSGMILVTGPTGSGKTTTLYTLIKLLNNTETSIVTIEDPVEYSVSGTKQIQTNARVGLTFANGLRSILRQDPDVIMVGEIRDTETAQIAVNTALTGHLLLSTLHTIDSASAIPRLLDMNIESFLIASTLRLVIAQRLVRKICQSCKKIRAVSNVEKEMFSHLYKHELKNAWVGNGCEECKFTGYCGRMVVCEVFFVNEFISEAIATHSGLNKLKSIAADFGMTSLVKDGIRKIEQGLTTVEEILHCLNE